MIIGLYQAQNHVMLSLTEQLVPVFGNVVGVVPQATREQLVLLIRSLAMQFPYLFQGHPELLGL
jgi:hypothetical protein